MVMAAPVVLMLVAGDAIVKCNLAGQAAIGEQFESAVHGGEPDVRVFLLYQLIEFVSREMRAGFKKRAENRATLSSLLQPNAPQVAEKNAFGLANVFGRDGRLVVDSFLQHG
jgi:hypothetical protein